MSTTSGDTSNLLSRTDANDISRGADEPTTQTTRGRRNPFRRRARDPSRTEGTPETSRFRWPFRRQPKDTTTQTTIPISPSQADDHEVSDLSSRSVYDRRDDQSSQSVDDRRADQSSQSGYDWRDARASQLDDDWVDNLSIQHGDDWASDRSTQPDDDGTDQSGQPDNVGATSLSVRSSNDVPPTDQSQATRKTKPLLRNLFHRSLGDPSVGNTSETERPPKKKILRYFGTLLKDTATQGSSRPAKSSQADDDNGATNMSMALVKWVAPTDQSQATQTKKGRFHNPFSRSVDDRSGTKRLSKAKRIGGRFWTRRKDPTSRATMRSTNDEPTDQSVVVNGVLPSTQNQGMSRLTSPDPATTFITDYIWHPASQALQWAAGSDSWPSCVGVPCSIAYEVGRMATSHATSYLPSYIRDPCSRAYHRATEAGTAVKDQAISQLTTNIGEPAWDTYVDAKSRWIAEHAKESNITQGQLDPPTRPTPRSEAAAIASYLQAQASRAKITCINLAAADEATEPPTEPTEKGWLSSKFENTTMGGWVAKRLRDGHSLNAKEIKNYPGEIDKVMRSHHDKGISKKWIAHQSKATDRMSTQKLTKHLKKGRKLVEELPDDWEGTRCKDKYYRRYYGGGKADHLAGFTDVNDGSGLDAWSAVPSNFASDFRLGLGAMAGVTALGAVGGMAYPIASTAASAVGTAASYVVGGPLSGAGSLAYSLGSCGVNKVFGGMGSAMVDGVSEAAADLGVTSNAIPAMMLLGSLGLTARSYMGRSSKAESEEAESEGPAE